MVNKAAIGVLAVIVVVVLGGGLLLGTLLDDSGETNQDGTDGPADEPAEEGTGEPTNGSTATGVAPGNSTENVTTEQPGSDDSTRTPTLSRRFERRDVAENITRMVNGFRTNQSLEPLSPEGRTAADVRTMAEGHSLAMADAGRVAHVIGGTNTSERYRNHGLYQTCKYADELNEITPGYQHFFEVLGSGTIGDYYNGNSSAQYIDDERQAANLIVQDMLDDPDVRERLQNEHFTRIGTGVEITRNNRVYVTLNFCS